MMSMSRTTLALALLIVFSASAANAAEVPADPGE